MPGGPLRVQGRGSHPQRSNHTPPPGEQQVSAAQCWKPSDAQVRSPPLGPSYHRLLPDRCSRLSLGPPAWTATLASLLLSLLPSLPISSPFHTISCTEQLGRTLKRYMRDFLGGLVVKNSLCKAGDRVRSPIRELRSHKLRSNEARPLQPPSPCTGTRESVHWDASSRGTRRRPDSAK